MALGGDVEPTRRSTEPGMRRSRSIWRPLVEFCRAAAGRRRREVRPEPDWTALRGGRARPRVSSRPAAVDAALLRRHPRGLGGRIPGRPEIPLRIEAAGYRGKPVSSPSSGPWTRPS